MSNEARQFRSILVPLDGSPLAEEAVPLAARIARQGGAKLRLALVHEPPMIPIDSPDVGAIASAEAATCQAEGGYLRRVQTGLRESGTEVESAVTLDGEIGPALADYARDYGIDLIVMATHGRGGVQRLWLGSVGDYLIRHLEVPILLVKEGQSALPPDPLAKATQLLVPLDGSALAEEALGPAEEFARLWGLELNLVRVVPPVTLVIDAGIPMPTSYDEDLTVRARSEAQDYLEDLVEDLQARGVRATCAALIGWNAVDSLLDVVRGERIALIAIATHGRGGIRRVAMGSVADNLVRGAPVPVLVYRPGTRISPNGAGRRQKAALAR